MRPGADIYLYGYPGTFNELAINKGTYTRRGTAFIRPGVPIADRGFLDAEVDNWFGHSGGPVLTKEGAVGVAHKRMDGGNLRARVGDYVSAMMGALKGELPQSGWLETDWRSILDQGHFRVENRLLKVRK